MSNYQAAHLRHREMLDALAARDPERARQAVQGDIQGGFDQLFPLLSKFIFLNCKSALPTVSSIRSVSWSRSRSGRVPCSREAAREYHKLELVPQAEASRNSSARRSDQSTAP